MYKCIHIYIYIYICKFKWEEDDSYLIMHAECVCRVTVYTGSLAVIIIRCVVPVVGSLHVQSCIYPSEYKLDEKQVLTLF